MSGRRAGRGFTLIEVLIALAILGIGLGVLMHAMASSLSGAARTRGLTIATLLARSKMVDVEQRVLDEGFTVGDVEDEGDFTDDGHPEIKWRSRIIEVQLDLGSLDKMAGGALGGSGGESEGGGGAGDLVGMLGGSLEGLTKQMGDAMRVAEVTVTYPSDGTHVDTLVVRSVLTRDDLANPGQNDLQSAQQAVQQGIQQGLQQGTQQGFQQPFTGGRR